MAVTHGLYLMYCRFRKVFYGGVFDIPTLDCFPIDERDSIARDEIVSCLDVVLWEAGVFHETDLLCPT